MCGRRVRLDDGPGVLLLRDRSLGLAAHFAQRSTGVTVVVREAPTVASVAATAAAFRAVVLRVVAWLPCGQRTHLFLSSTKRMMRPYLQ